MDNELLKTQFRELFGTEPRFFRAPGRVNLIGEHTDYNDGFVLPFAIDRETRVAAAPRSDRRIRAFTANLGVSAECDLDLPYTGQDGSWFRYVEGVARILDADHFAVRGADLLISSNVPTGAGLSSSAALEIAVGFALSSLSGGEITRTALAKTGQRTEHEFIGAQIGIMDQFVSANAVADHALFLDCRSLDFENVPFDTKEFAVVICDSRIRHELAESGYNDRRRECAEAVRHLQTVYPAVQSLRDVSREMLDALKDEMPDVNFRRARHVISENERVERAVSLLKTFDLKGFGVLMNESHASMRDDYEITCPEIDYLAELAQTFDGVAGSRMTGGGFGGSTVNLVRREILNDFCSQLTSSYKNETGIEPTILITNACAGVEELK